MAMAVFLKTESCDYYLWAFDHDDIEKAIKSCKDDIGQEFGHVIHVQVSFSSPEWMSAVWACEQVLWAEIERVGRNEY